MNLNYPNVECLCCVFAADCHGLGVCPSVCPPHCSIVSKQCKLESRNLYCALPHGF